MSVLYFNSHAHVERDHSILISQRKIEISTHTLTWSVTCGEPERAADFKISTHTLTWSVTSGFYSTNELREISTHTLTWSVTCVIMRFVQVSRNFNSHAHVERDWQPPSWAWIARHFNSHAHVERDAQLISAE